MTITGPHDYGDYHCVSKNELGITKGVFHVQGLCLQTYIFAINCASGVGGLKTRLVVRSRIIKFRAHLCVSTRFHYRTKFSDTTAARRGEDGYIRESATAKSNARRFMSATTASLQGLPRSQVSSHTLSNGNYHFSSCSVVVSTHTPYNDFLIGMFITVTM